MALVPFTPAAAAAAGALVEFGGGDGDSLLSEQSIPAMVAAQQELFHAQVEQLQRLVVAQCRLTGVNPLAQEMAAGALSIKIGKKPRDLLNPKAVKYMQSLFAVKDTIGKKETREISALCGVTVTQVRDFFANQRSRVRKLVRLSREKATRIEASKACDNASSISSEQAPSMETEAHASVVEPLRTAEPAEVPQNSGAPIAPTDTLHPGDVKTIPDAGQKETMQVEVVPGVASEDKNFLDSIFTLMGKEETFSGQVKLMEWILQINNVAVLSWFLTMGGLTILATWLSQAATEEQTSVILVIFKVLLHLPLHKALPVHMSAVLQTINRLRFYRTSDISNRARHLLSRLSKVLVRSQALKKPHMSASKDTQKELVRKQRISEILHDVSWKSEVEIPEEILALTDSANDSRKPEPRKALMLLPAPCDEPNKKNCLQTKTKERRKVLLVEHPNRKAAGRNVQVARSVSTNNSRPLSADDIQKAKMRAIFMQEKYGKVDTTKSADKPQTMESQKSSVLLNQGVMPASRSPFLSDSKKSVDPSPSASKPSTVPHKAEISVSSKPNSTSRENLIERLESKKVRWQTPPEVRIDLSWSVGAGESSKELEVQTQRNWREKETFYPSPEDIPLNPKDPWDMEMDFDDSLTPEIPIDQPLDADAMEVDNVAAPPDTGVHVEDKQIAATSSAPPAVANGVDGAAGEPDLELLAVLLKNPELVFALTSGQGQTLPSEQTVALLDMLKQSGVGVADLVNGLSNGAMNPKEPEPEPETIPTSLPSPTPPSDPAARASWRSEFPTPVRVPTQQMHFSGSQGATPAANTMRQSFSSTVSSVPSQSYAAVSGLPAHTPATVLSLPQLAVNVNPPTQQRIAPVNTLPYRGSVQQHAQSYASVPDPVLSPLHQPVASGPAYNHQNVSNHSLMRSFMPEPKAYTATSWQSSAANVAINAKRDTTPDPWARRTNNSFDGPPSNSLPYPNPNAYNTCNAYNSASVPAHPVLPGQGLDRNGYADTSDVQIWGRDHGRHSRSPEFGAGWDYSGQQRMDSNPEPSRQWNSRHKDYYNSSDSRRSYDWDRDHDRYRRR